MSDIVVTVSMVEDLLHRNEVDIDHKRKEIERFKNNIRMRENRIQQLSEDRVYLLEKLEEVKQNGR